VGGGGRRVPAADALRAVAVERQVEAVGLPPRPVPLDQVVQPLLEPVRGEAQGAREVLQLPVARASKVEDGQLRRGPVVGQGRVAPRHPAGELRGRDDADGRTAAGGPGPPAARERPDVQAGDAEQQVGRSEVGRARVLAVEHEGGLQRHRVSRPRAEAGERPADLFRPGPASLSGERERPEVERQGEREVPGLVRRGQLGERGHGPRPGPQVDRHEPGLVRRARREQARGELLGGDRGRRGRRGKELGRRRSPGPAPLDPPAGRPPRGDAAVQHPYLRQAGVLQPQKEEAHLAEVAGRAVDDRRLGAPEAGGTEPFPQPRRLRLGEERPAVESARKVPGPVRRLAARVDQGDGLSGREPRGEGGGREQHRRSRGQVRPGRRPLEGRRRWRGGAHGRGGEKKQDTSLPRHAEMLI
jgi:hypothetical protein